jgi:HEAT repeats
MLRAKSSCRAIVGSVARPRDEPLPDVTGVGPPKPGELPEGPPPRGGEPSWRLTRPVESYLRDYPESRAPKSVAEVRLLVYQLTHAPKEHYLGPLVSLAWIGPAAVPYFEEAYPRTTRAQGRVRLLFFSLGYANTSEAAFRLGVAATRDKSFLVRYRACMLLGRSRRPDAVGPLRELLNHSNPRTVSDAKSALFELEQTVGRAAN